MEIIIDLTEEETERVENLALQCNFDTKELFLADMVRDTLDVVEQETALLLNLIESDVTKH